MCVVVVVRVGEGVLSCVLGGGGRLVILGEGGVCWVGWW